MSAGPVLDFRSDTRTLPDARMRAAMAGAQVGDDAYGDDPGVLELQRRGARLLGTQAALFVPSSTMANLLAVLAASPAPGAAPGTGPGAVVVTGADSHLARFEAQGVRRFAGAALVPVAQGPDGAPRPGPWARAIGGAAGRPLVVSLENTCMLHTGNALPPRVLEAAAAAARRQGAHVHLDGARLGNAAVALGLPVARLAACADSVTFCLAKGLGAPVGSLLGAGRDFVARARELRGQLGGTMHQAGVVAAAALAALDRLPELAADHALAAALTAALAALDGVQTARPPCPTNIVAVRVPGLDAAALTGRLAAAGVLVLPLDDGWVRLVVHRAHTRAAVPAVAAAVRHAATAPVPH